MWKTLKDEPIPDIKQWISLAAAGGKAVHIGTDSLQTARYTQFVTVVVIHTPGKGGRAAYLRRTVPKIHSLRAKLTEEVWESLKLAMDISDLNVDLTVHIDANTDKRHKSGKFAEELAGMVMSQGFKYLLKPEAWAATHVGDWTVRKVAGA